MNLKDYEALTNAYIESGGNVEAAARIARIGTETARRIIDKGTKTGFPPIRERVQKLTQVALQQSDEERLRHARNFKVAYVLLARQLSVLAKVKLKPRGLVGPDGSIEVNETTFDRLARCSELLAKFGDSVLNRSEGRPAAENEPGNLTISVTANARVMQGAYYSGLSKRDAYAKAQSILKENAFALGKIAGTPGELEFVKRVSTSLSRLTINKEK